jgi:resuscitation-promoting factor RpfB
VKLEQSDAVEPSKTTRLVAPSYDVNIYRARPVTVVDGAARFRIMSPYQSAKKIAEAAGLQVYDEDTLVMSRIDDFVGEEGVGLKLIIKRSVPLDLVLYGKQIHIRTQAKTVAALVKEKNITLGASDGISPAAQTAIAANMTVDVYRNGEQTINEEQDVAFTTKQIQDADQPVGYKQVQTPGTPGKKIITYQIELKNGKEVSRKEIQSVVTVQPKEQVEVVGVKTAGFSGGFAEALARLSSCEGKYTSVNPAGPYYGAYQFNQGTWNAYAPDGYKGVIPTTAPPAVQDQAAANLYKARGWRPWPACSVKLGLQDIYR